MIDPIIFSIDLGFTTLTVRWYGLLIVAGVLAAAFYAAWYVRRKGEDPNLVWDMLIWLLISGIIGARAWYVIADIIGGGTRYTTDPFRIFYVNEGGLNILGGVILGTLVAWWYCQRHKVDFWLMADAVAPGYLIGQAIGRWGNFINQELYGPPTPLPWGIPIEGPHRIPPWNDLAQYPVESTFFHPTFAYEMIWNLIFAGLIIYLLTRHSHKLKTGMVAGLVLLAAGVGRAGLETYFRPDQPRFFGTSVSTSLVVSIIFALLGLLVVLVKNGTMRVPFMQPGSTEYTHRITRRAPVMRKARRQKM